MLQKHSKTIAAGILILFFFVSLIVSNMESTTMDEQAHIPAGYTYVKYNDMRLNPEHPPLIKDLAGFPLLFLNPSFPINDPSWTEGINEQWTLGNKFIHSNNADAITFWSRFPIILIAMLLGWFIFRWTKELVGSVAGLFALTIYAFNPNILGHSHYVTTDIGIATFIFISFYYFLKFVKNPSWKNVLLAGIFLGLAQAAKFSAVLLFPFFALIIFVYTLNSKNPSAFKITRFNKINSLIEYTIKYATAVLVCFVLLWALYFYNTFNMPVEKIQDIANSVFANEGAGALANSAVIWITSIPILNYLSEYFLGVFMVFVRVTGGNTYYFFGEVSNQATAWYFPAVYFLKETLPVIILILTTGLYSIFKALNHISLGKNFLRENWKKLARYLRTSVVQYSMLGFIVLYSYLSITGNLNIGFRHLFPILPFIYVLTVKALFDAYKKFGRKSRTILKTGLVILTAWIILEPIASFPYYLSYFNQIAGGHSKGYQYVTDSNYDWGQDLKKLNHWVDKYNQKNSNRPIEKIRVDYFGGSNPAYYLRDKFIPWHFYNNPEPGWYAISIGFLQESVHKKETSSDAKNYRWIMNYTPCARVGDSFFVYFISPKGLE